MADLFCEELKGLKVLVLGGSGVIGSRLVEILVQETGANVSVLVRNLTKAVRIARYPIELIHGDVKDTALLEKVMAGKDVVVDLTFPKAGEKEERCRDARSMAHTIGRAAIETGIRRLVHLSTISVYGRPDGHILDETSSRNPGKDPYGASKLAGEAEMLRLCREESVPVVILQPTIVYGPFTGWSAGPITQLNRGVFVLPEGGSGICNAVYIDDVVQAILRAAVTEDIDGEVFLISGKPAVTWKEFYGAYEKMIGFTATLPMTEKEIQHARRAGAKAAHPFRRLLKTLRRDAELRQMILSLPVITHCYAAIKTIAGAERMEGIKDRMLDRKPLKAETKKPLIYPTTTQMGIFVPKTAVSIEKAHQLLGYMPNYSLETGMALTSAWAKWARLV